MFKIQMQKYNKYQSREREIDGMKIRMNPNTNYVSPSILERDYNDKGVFVDLTYDSGFKAVFADRANKTVLICLLNHVLPPEARVDDIVEYLVSEYIFTEKTHRRGCTSDNFSYICGVGAVRPNTGTKRRFGCPIAKNRLCDMNRSETFCANTGRSVEVCTDMDKLAAFIAEHNGDDPDRLALQKGKWPGIDVAAAVSTLVSRKKLTGKAPLWASAEGLVLPRTLSAEQCSGEAAARHKAAAAIRLGAARPKAGVERREESEQTAAEQTASKRTTPWRPRIADLTGGLGVDVLEFSRVAEAVLYNEILPELAAAAEHNFKVLGARNIEICNLEASTETLGSRIPEELSGHKGSEQGSGTTEGCAGSLRRRLEEFRPDVIFLDPARRDGCGKKVFLLEDCSPDILKIKDLLLDLAPVLMLKLSPMADVSMVLERLGNECRELQIIEAGGECKELLVIMSRDVSDSCLIRVYNLDTEKKGVNEYDSPVMEFFSDAENGRKGLQLAELKEIVPGALLFEPGKALMKAGCFKLIGERLGAPALGHDTHYYILGSCTIPESAKTGKLFRILDVAEMSGKALRDFAKRHPEAEVTARNVHMTSEELRRRLGCKPSDRHHIFALHADAPGKNLLLFTERIQKDKEPTPQFAF